MSLGEGLSDSCVFCGSRCAYSEFPVCPACHGRPAHSITASAARPIRKPDPALLAAAVLSIRDYVMTDAVPETAEAQVRPRYITSSKQTGEIDK